MKRPAREPDVLGYGDHRAYLRDYYRARKAADRAFSYGVFSRKAGFSARGHLKAVIDYGKDLSERSARALADALGLDPGRSEYFRLLVHLGQARGMEERRGAEAAIRRWRWDRERREPTEREARGFGSSWASYGILAMSRARGFRPDPAWISRRFEGRITRAEAARALRGLRAARLLSWSGGKVRFSAGGALATGGGIDMRKVVRRSLREALHREASGIGAPGVGSVGAVLLPPAEIEALHRRYADWVKENAPRPRGRRGEELCLVLWAAFPVTSGVSVARGRKRLPAGRRFRA